MDNRKKNLLNSNTSSTYLRNITAEICWRVWGTPANFNGVRVITLGHIPVTLFWGSLRARTCGPILKIYTSCDVFSRREVPFGGRDEIAPHLGGQLPKNRNYAA